jgi:processed acidic surface protein
LLLKKSIWIGFLSFQLLLLPNGITALAAPPENELNQYLAQIGWTKQQLMDYLNYYEIPLDELSSVADLKDVMGTPINDQNYHKLLTKYNLSDQELKNLLSQFGDSLENYTFIEDLNTSVDFYENHNNMMGEIQNELGKIGITEQEINKFFDYLSQVEEDNKSQLDKIQALDTRLEKFLDESDPTQLTNSEIDELAQILTQVFDLYEIQVKFKMNNKNFDLSNLL